MAETRRTMPALAGSRLDGVPVSLPGDLTAARTLVLVAFRQWQQLEVDTWLPLAAELAASRVDFAYLEVPLLGGWWRPARPLIDGGMRAGIPDAATRATTVTVYGGRRRFLRGVGAAGIGAIVVLVVDADGVVLWQGRGATSAKAVAAVRAAVGR